MTDLYTGHIKSITTKQYLIIISILSLYSSKIEQVKVFGSRATNNYRLNSDLDLVIYGNISSDELARLYTLFSDSSLPFRVDLQAYDLIFYLPLKQHIDDIGVLLATQGDLTTVVKSKLEVTTKGVI